MAMSVNKTTEFVSWSSVTVSLASCCRVPIQISWVLSAFSFSLLDPIHSSRALTHAASLAAAAWDSDAGTLTYNWVSSAYEWPDSPNDSMTSKIPAAYNKNRIERLRIESHNCLLYIYHESTTVYSLWDGQWLGWLSLLSCLGRWPIYTAMIDHWHHILMWCQWWIVSVEWPIDIASHCRENWESAHVVNFRLLDDPATWHLSFDLLQRQ